MTLLAEAFAELLEGKQPDDVRQSSHMTREDKQLLMKLLHQAMWGHANNPAAGHRPEDGNVNHDARAIIDAVEDILDRTPDGETYEPANPRLQAGAEEEETNMPANRDTAQARTRGLETQIGLNKNQGKHSQRRGNQAAKRFRRSVRGDQGWD